MGSSRYVLIKGMYREKGKTRNSFVIVLKEVEEQSTE